MKDEIGKGPPALGILMGSGPKPDPHEGHDDKHAMCARIAELLGAKLSSAEEDDLCDALSAFIDEHMSEDSKEDEDKDEEGEEEDEG